MPLLPTTATDARRTWALVAFLIAVLIIWQFGDIGRTPLQAWDESRLAVNAIEMLMTGERFVTTYGFHVDLWSTKPPLAVNLMAWSMELFGPTAIAARLPSAIAACATVVVVTASVRRITGSFGCGLAAGALLATAPSFYGYHSGRAGDYDAVLTLFTTVYGFALFDLIGRERPTPWLALGTGVVVGLAVWTKGIAGLIPGAGMGFFALIFAFPALRRKIADYAIVLVIAAVMAGGFYALRGLADDGYLAAVVNNELGGRFGVAIEHHVGSRWFYVRELTRYFPGRAWLAVAALPLLAAGPARRLAIFGLCQIVVMVLIYSSAATKIAWYIVPTVPFVATVVAIAGLALIRAATRFPPGVSRGINLAILAIGIILAVIAVNGRYLHTTIPPTPPRAFDTLIAAATERRLVPLVVVDTGFPNAAGFVAYSPTLRFYALAAARRGIAVRRVTRFAEVGGTKAFGTCDPAIQGAIAGYGTSVWSGSGCVLAVR